MKRVLIETNFETQKYITQAFRNKHSIFFFFFLTLSNFQRNEEHFRNFTEFLAQHNTIEFGMRNEKTQICVNN